MSFLTSLFQFGAGHRTEIIAAVNFGLQFAKICGAPIPDALLYEVGKASIPLGAMTFAAKVSRIQQDPPKAPAPAVDVS